MRKIYGILIGACIIVGIFSVVAMADTPTDSSVQPQADVALIPTNNGSARIRGVWGYAGDNVTQGYFGVKIVQKNNIYQLGGRWNTTDNESSGKIIGVLRRGYFNGKIILSNGSKIPITGLYRVDKEKNQIFLRWMTPEQDGWAVGKIITMPPVKAAPETTSVE
jgi:hypothetical protein